MHSYIEPGPTRGGGPWSSKLAGIDVVADGENVWAEYNNAAEKLLIASSGMSLKLVAGAGFVRYLPFRIS